MAQFMLGTTPIRSNRNAISSQQQFLPRYCVTVRVHRKMLQNNLDFNLGTNFRSPIVVLRTP